MEFLEQLIIPFNTDYSATQDTYITVDLFNDGYSDSLGTLFIPISSEITCSGKYIMQWYPITSLNNGSKICEISIAIQYLPEKYIVNPINSIIDSKNMLNNSLITFNNENIKNLRIKFRNIDFIFPSNRFGVVHP